MTSELFFMDENIKGVKSYQINVEVFEYLYLFFSF
ncbi:hypothetical protein ABH968_002327 [Lysinibacillus sp. RC79]